MFPAKFVKVQWCGRVCALICALASYPHAVTAIPYFARLGDLPGGGYVSQATAVSADGSVVVGISGSLDGWEPFTWTSSTGMVGLGQYPGTTGGGGTYANDVSDDGSVIVGTATKGGGRFEAFKWTQSTGMVGLGALPNPVNGLDSSETFGVSGDGQIVVGRSFGRFGMEAFRTSNTSMIGLGDLPGAPFTSIAFDASQDGSVITGVSRTGLAGEISQAFRWTAESGMVGLGDLPGGEVLSGATAISRDGSTIVGYGTTDFGREAMLWTESQGMISLGEIPGGPHISIADAVSDDGSVVVGRSLVAGGQEAFIWDESGGMRTLLSYLTEAFLFDLSGWHLQEAVGISADGTVIVGTGISPYDTREAWFACLSDRCLPPSVDPSPPPDFPQVVPEPASIALVMAGIIGVAFVRRRSRSF